ncbi:MAG TPA: ABC transporter permease [Candidatus Acidoferrum sp.]|nr:ABC transporter permease [Candidatus Acidoferrum sp.]
MLRESWNRILAKLKALVRRRQLDADLRDELAFHLSMREQKNLQSGMDAQEARYAARRQFGNVTSTKESSLEMLRFAAFEGFFQDLRFGARQLRKSPGFTAAAVLTLALGIGANTAIFSVAYNVLIRPLPFSDPGRLVMVWEDASAYGFPQDTPAPANFASWQADNRVFTGMAAMERQRFSLTGQGEPIQLVGEEVTANMFPLLGVQPMLGRNILPEEDKPGAPRVALLSHAVWMTTFGGSSQVLGQQIWLNDSAKYTIIGVMPRGFVFPDRETQIWIPMRFSDKDLAQRGSHYLQVVARLKENISLRQANADLAIIARRLSAQFPDSNANVGAYAVPLRNRLTGNSRLASILLLAAVGFVLLTACANVAGLQLARSTSRKKELLLRLALGASRLRIVRQLLVESILLSLVAGFAGLLFALWSSRFLAYLVPNGLAPVDGSGMNLTVLLFLLAVSLLCGVFFGLAPALHISRLDIASPVKEATHAGAGSRMRDVLVVSEVALALVLFSGAALMVRSFLNVRGLDPGFRPSHVLAAQTDLPFPKYQDPVRRNAFFQQVLDRLNHSPGVLAAGCTTWLPLTNWGGASSIAIEGHPALAPGQRLIPNIRMISSRYMQAMGMRLVQGRTFDQRDAANTPLVAIVNQSAARDYWHGLSPVGARIKRDSGSQSEPWINVVGVVADVRSSGLDEPARPTIYFPYDQHDYFAPSYLVLRSSGDPMALANTLRQQVWAVDKDQPITGVLPLEQMLEDYLAPRKLQSSLLAGFAAFALLLAMLGIYALLAFSVASRTREIGLRVALGAQPRDIVRSLLAQGLTLAAIGVAVGSLGALALGQAFRNLLFGVSAADPLTLAATILVLLFVSSLACFLPALRASRVHPAVALRHE